MPQTVCCYVEELSWVVLWRCVRNWSLSSRVQSYCPSDSEAGVLRIVLGSLLAAQRFA
jgi:hypothetical protein